MPAPASALPANDAPLLHLTPPSEEESSPASTPSPHKRFVFPFRIPAAMPPLLLLLTAAPLLLLPLAVWQSVQSGQIARDINRSGSLRYQAMWLYGATTAAPKEGATENWQARWHEMQSIRADLGGRYSREVAQTDAAWKAFGESLQGRNTVSWRDANALRESANVLTNTIEEKLQASTMMARVLYGVGIVSLLCALPWSYQLAHQLRRTKTALEGHETALADASIRYDRLFEGLPSACFGYDTHGRITTWNRASEALFGLPSDEVIGKPLWEAVSRPENWQRSQRIVREVLGGVPCPDLEWVYETPNGGPYKEVVSTIFPI